MAHTNGPDGSPMTIARYYIDVRPHALISVERRTNSNGGQRETLPLIHTLPLETREAILRYVRKPDRYMSLSSALLKHLFIHKHARIPWSQVEVRRTPRPHARPYWAPPHGWKGKGFEGLEFNVSHQAGMVVLVGCKTPNRSRDVRIDDRSEISIRSPTVINPDPTAVLEADSWIDQDEPEDVRIGVDVACTWEPPRTQDLSTQEKLEEWVDIFEEMFSPQEQHDMKHAPLEAIGGMTESETKARRFYTYWALKEAYIKMVGEGLLAPWLRQLEFRNVPVPAVDDHSGWEIMSDREIADFSVYFKNKDISGTLTTSLESFEDTFLIATMTRGVVDRPQQQPRWQEIDLLGEIELCATEKCTCLE